ncbi:MULTISPECIES: ABC transporter substrate-binding protein [Bradyrhizobium]|uniref:Peptide/nickel transport system substrate-binding protein n=2 Tax=Bradyrhizobium TaxID=374 RepID=A0ABY0PKT4_9BRAD|nr:MULTISPECIES: ABC transporter substrate-binding protein [Bradyrhizobium]SDI58408.1 peptide/nickel transport system substrate-binding protein [Bradyrhizobium ottawaense]SED39076.1 peptide/nickel transport system substrate-binding protein [Bradyrhizobium lablabi]SHL40315.1 peptide/nickel transport system substrate-binding protein [Bradyrhizobium lablabi]
MKRRDFLKSVSGLAATSALTSAPAIWSAAKADARSETLLIVSEGGPNNLDIHGVGTNVPGYEVSWNCYDRLISHEMKEGPGGVPYYDRDKFKPELAEDMNIGDMSVTFKLKKNAKFHDGTPVTAKDAKWSLDRAVSVGGFPTFQMSAGSLTKAEQFVVVDDNTIRVDFARKDKLTIPDLAVIVPCIVNSELVKKNASEKDPWGLEFTKQQTAGSGAYKVTKWTAGTEVIMERNDEWVGGPLPKIKRVIWRMVPQAGNRRALLERGDADISYELPNKDFQELKAAGKLNIVSLPFSNGIQYLGMNVTKPPFNNPKVREAIAYAVPYQKIMDVVLFGLANPMFGAPASKATEVAWPQPTKYFTDMAKAKALLTEAGYPDGFETTISFDLNFAGINEPLCVLVQESLAQIGIKTTINKVPGANWRTELNKKEMPLYTNVFSGWLDYPEYFFYWCYHGNNSVFNTMSYKSPEMDRLIDGARTAAAAGDKATYDTDVKGMVDLAFTDIPRIPLYQPFVNVAMQKNITGYQYWFHRRLDYRALAKG